MHEGFDLKMYACGSYINTHAYIGISRFSLLECFSAEDAVSGTWDVWLGFPRSDLKIVFFIGFRVEGLVGLGFRVYCLGFRA